MYTDETILEEMLSFAKFRSEFMEKPYVICGERYVELLKEYCDNKGINYEVEEAWKEGNMRFIFKK